MYRIELNSRYSEVGFLQVHARRQYATLPALKEASGATLRVQRVPKRDEWRLLLGADRREIGRVRKIEAPAVIESAPVRFRDVARTVAVAVLALVGLTWR